MSKGFWKRFIICFIAYVLLMTGIIVILSDILKKAHIAIKISVGVVIILLFASLILYIEKSRGRKK